MTNEELQTIAARVEALPANDLAIHYPQGRSKPYIIALDDKGSIAYWIARGLWKDDESHDYFEFFAHARADIPALLAEIERLQKAKSA